MFIAFCSAATVSLGDAELRELREHVEIIREAAGLGSMEKLAYALGVDEAQLHNQLKGTGHLSLTRVVVQIGMRDPAFFPRYAWLMACRYGLPKETRIAADMERAMAARRPVVGMDATQSQKRSAVR